MLSITSDYARDEGCPQEDLERIAEAGFSHVHWCHQWNTDFLYDPAEVEQISAWLRAFGLRLNDLHGSDGVEKCWVSPREYERRAGAALVKNRIAMTRRLDSDAVIMHLGDEPEDPAERTVFWTQLRRSLDEIESCARDHRVRLAIENGEFGPIKTILAEYAPDYLGLCYDSGHGNLIPNGLEELETLKHRLLAIHLHDNDGASDQHKLPFTGAINWPRLARIIATSAYKKCINLESNMHNAGIPNETDFLEQAFRAGTTLAQMIAAR